MSQYLNIDQLIQKVLPCFTKGAVYKMVQRKLIPHHKVGNRIVFKKSDIDRWMDDHEVYTEHGECF